MRPRSKHTLAVSSARYCTENEVKVQSTKRLHGVLEFVHVWLPMHRCTRDKRDKALHCNDGQVGMCICFVKVKGYIEHHDGPGCQDIAHEY